MNKFILIISAVGLIFSFAYFNISVWNNIDWLLLERGYYTAMSGIIVFSVISAAKSITTVVEKGGTKLDRIYAGIASVIAVVSIIYCCVSIYNTDWVYLEKGYYWGATAFITITAALTWISLEIVARENAAKRPTYEEG